MKINQNLQTVMPNYHPLLEGCRIQILCINILNQKFALCVWERQEVGGWEHYHRVKV